MDSASLQFIAYGLAVAILSNFSKSTAWRTAVLLLASVIFLFILSPTPLALLPLAAFLALGYIAISFPVQISVPLVLIAFIWLKKYTFLPHATFLTMAYVTLGLSYILFRVLHLVIDRERINIASYLAYTINFTTFISGPVQMYPDFAAPPAGLDLTIVATQLERIVRGFFKVNVLAVLINTIRLDALARLTEHLPPSAKMGSAITVTIAFPLYLYCNFSGYIDIVIAIARLMRLQLPENFDRPFSATSFIDFWNRWHITVSTWLKTYVYNPLLMTLMRRITSIALEPFLGVLCFFITFFLIGVWHGRTSEFVMFGVLQGTGVALNKLWQVLLTKRMGRKQYRALSANLIYESLGRGLTFSWFALTLFWFWGSWADIHSVFASLSLVNWLLVWTAIWVLATLALAAWEWLRALLCQPLFLNRYARTVYSTAMFVTSFVMVALLSDSSPQIVYKAF